MSIRHAGVADLDAIMALEEASFPSDAWSRETMRAELASEHSHYVVEDVAGSVVGYAGLRAIRGSRDADVQTIALAESQRGLGRGRALLRNLLTEAGARGAREVFLEVRADNPVATALYVGEGFTELGRRPRYYQPDDVDAVVMRLDLRRWAERVLGAAGAGSAAGAQAGEEIARSGGDSERNGPPEREKSARTGDAVAADAAADAASGEGQAS